MIQTINKVNNSKVSELLRKIESEKVCEAIWVVDDLNCPETLNQVVKTFNNYIGDVDQIAEVIKNQAKWNEKGIVYNIAKNIDYLNSLPIITKKTVKKSDLDIYNHLNNANTSLYFEDARIELQRRYNIEDEKILENGHKLVLKDKKTEYFQQAYENDNLIIYSTLNRGKVKFTFYHEMKKENDLIAKCKSTHCFIKNNKPVRVPKKYN